MTFSMNGKQVDLMKICLNQDCPEIDDEEGRLKCPNQDCGCI